MLRHPFSAHSSPKGPLKLCSLTQRSHVCLFVFVLFCFIFFFFFFSFWSKNYKFDTWRPLILEFLIVNDKFVSESKIFYKFPTNLMKKYIFFVNLSLKDPFEKSHFSPKDPLNQCRLALWSHVHWNTSRNLKSSKSGVHLAFKHIKFWTSFALHGIKLRTHVLMSLPEVQLTQWHLEAALKSVTLIEYTLCM